MSRREKLLARLQNKPKDFTWDELETLLVSLGYTLVKTGKTGGSRRKFTHPSAGMINLHKPHPGNVLKRYQIEQIVEMLALENFS